MTIDVLVAEIGSTTTVVNGFDGMGLGIPKFIGQGQAPTTVSQGDVCIGLHQAILSLQKKMDIEKLNYREMLATSSAAGGLKMTVHGLAHDMTVKAATEAALGAGAIVKLVTGGRLKQKDLENIQEVEPNIILLAGGVDYGERDTALYNAEILSEMNLNIPIIYGGNIEIQEEIKEIFENSGFRLYVVENVYPKMDTLNIEPTRKIIQKVFEEHIIQAPGMENVREMVNGPIIPTPGAVMEAAWLLYEEIGDLVTLDVGGATTDIHSVTEGSPDIGKILISPEPKGKRTVEGDLGVYVNAENIIKLIGKERLEHETKLNVNEILQSYQAIPKNENEIRLVKRLTEEACKIALRRHCGNIKKIRSHGGKSNFAEGKDLTAVESIICTGGALTRLPNAKNMVAHACKNNEYDSLLLPKKDVEIFIDHDYIMASLGVLSKLYPREALQLLKNSMKFENI